MVRVKICGLTRVEEAIACAASGADWIGLNCHPGSPRYVAPEQARAIAQALPPSVAAVGIFVDRPAGEVAELANRLGIGIVQLHGQEPPEDLIALRSFQVVRAFRLGCASDWSGVIEYLGRAKVLGAVAERGSDRRVRGRPARRDGGGGCGRGSGVDAGPAPGYFRRGFDAGECSRACLAGSTVDGRRREWRGKQSRPEGPGPSGCVHSARAGGVLSRESAASDFSG